MAIYYASKTLVDAQIHYSTTGKESLALVFALENFRSYLSRSKVIVYSDYAALKFLLKMKEAKPRFIRWILLLQEFEIEINYKRGSKNVVANHLSRISIDELLALPIQYSFLNEHILEVKLKWNPWYAHIVNYLITRKVPNDWDYNERKNFFKTLPHYFWEEPELFYLGVDQVLRRCVSKEEQGKILERCHSSSYGGHYSSKITATKLLQCGFYWPTFIKDTHNFYLKFLTCQAAIKIDKKNSMPLQPILEVEVFNPWGIDFMEPFPNSNGYEYIFMAVDYVS